MLPETTLALHASRRQMLRLTVGVGAGVALGGTPHPAFATATELSAAIASFTAGAAANPGRVMLDVAPLVENGNSVPITVSVQSPMTAADHVTAVAVFNESNPQRDVAVFRLGPRAGRAVVATRIRLATSQRLVAVAQLSDGTFWSGAVNVIVTLAACVES